MEAFSLLKYLRGGGGGGATTFSGDAGSSSRSTDSSTAGTTTIVTTVTDSDSDSDSGNEDGPFFDLEFTPVPEDEGAETESQNCGENEEKIGDILRSGDESGESDDDDGDELKLAFSPSAAAAADGDGEGGDATVSLSPRDDLFFKGRLVPVEHSSLNLAASEASTKFPVKLLKSATKFRVMMLKLKKPKANVKQNREKSERRSRTERDESQIRADKKLFTVKFKVEEVKIRSLFTRDNSSKGNSNSKSEQKQNSDESNLNSSSTSKEMIQKYLKLVKPLYIRVSKRYSDKLGISGHFSVSGGAAAEKPETEATELTEKAKFQKQRVLPKNLMKSRSASSAAVAAAPVTSQRRRDDSLLEQHDGIQGAILHCKRSFNSSRDSCNQNQPATKSYSSSSSSRKELKP